MLLLTK